MKIEFFYFTECANHEAAWLRLRQVLKQEHIEADVTRIDVTSEDMAQACRFPGSPTIRINGIDIDPQAPAEFGMKCRIYPTAEGPSGIPAEAMIREALRKTGNKGKGGQ